MRFAKNKVTLLNSQLSAKPCSSKPLKKDGTPDMKYICNKNPSASSQKTSSCCQEPLKKNSATDRTSQANGTKSSYIPDSSGSSSFTGGPLKKDGTPDRRYAVNKGYRSSLSSISSTSGCSSVGAPSFIPSGPLKKDGTPEIR